MLLVVDVGNTNTVLGLLEGETVRQQWRVSTIQRTTDEVGLILTQLLALRDCPPGSIEGVILSCVVPSTLYSLEKAVRRYLQVEPLVVGSGIRTGMRVRTDNPREVGADRIVNAVAAAARFEPPLVVVDFGTATTFDCVDGRGDYVGGAIAPGLAISAEALFTETSKLPRVPVKRPAKAIGSNTVSAIQSGLFHGYVGLVNELARVCKRELGGRVTSVATGGFANLIARECAEIEHVDEHLTLRGLSLLWHRNQR